MGRYEVKYIENGVEKTSEKFADRDEAFAFQSGLLAKRQRKADGAWDIEPVGVYDLTPVGG
jgi:hypothetical protein